MESYDSYECKARLQGTTRALRKTHVVMISKDRKTRMHLEVIKMVYHQITYTTSQSRRRIGNNSGHASYLKDYHESKRKLEIWGFDF